MIIKRIRLQVAALVLCGLVSQLQAATTAYTDESAWSSAVYGNFIVEDFEDEILNPGVSISGETHMDDGTISGTLIRGQGFDATVSFESGIYSFGGEWNLSQLGTLGDGIEATITLLGGGAEVISVEIPNTMTGGFWGFVSDTAFADVILNAGTQGSTYHQRYTLDNMVYSSLPTAVPVPAAIWLFGAGLLGFIGYGRKKGLA
jgi:hypothetical protein